MSDTVDINTIVTLMEHFLEVHHKQTHEATERLTALARSVGVERHFGETLDSLVDRVRRLSHGDFSDEEPPTFKEPNPHVK